jgi:hypothetical protein
MTRTSQQTTNHNGFAIPLLPETELGLAMLIAESEDGQHEPVAVVGTINEAREAAESDLRERMRRLERGRKRVFARLCTKSGAAGSTALTALPARSLTSFSNTLTSSTSRAAWQRAAFSVLPTSRLAATPPAHLGAVTAGSAHTPSRLERSQRGPNVPQRWPTQGSPTAAVVPSTSPRGPDTIPADDLLGVEEIDSQ